jgi:ADP-ribosylglycohydrolase
MHDVLDARDILSDELVQRRESGYDVEGFVGRIKSALTDRPEEELWRLLELLEDAPRRQQWFYDEPSGPEEIMESLPKSPQLLALSLGEEDLRDRVRAAWLGRCAGCTLGKPVEGWTREDIRRYLELAGEYPIQDYFPRLEPMPEGLQMHPSWRNAVREDVRFMARDDDIDYTILGLHILATYGFGFGPEDVAEQWMSHMPFLATYTAERAAYRNLVYGLRPPDTANYRNPYREWIGAQIRADIWGYVSPGEPARAAGLAFKDASLSHTANGIYGEMWASALIATCFVAQDMCTALEASLAFVPPLSRLAEALRYVISLYELGIEWEAARDELEKSYEHYSWVHTINNAAVVAAALLWGEGDYTRTIGLAVMGGWDTDCNGATAGSAFGAMHGTEALPEHWVRPLNDLVRSMVSEFDGSKLSDLAERTLRFALRPRP